MEAPRAEKVAVVDEVRAQFEASDAVVLTEYRGLKVSELAELRASMRPGGGEYRVYKNTLVRRAVESLDLDLGPALTGPTAIAFVKTKADGSPGDISTVAKALQAFARTNPLLVIKGGVLGDTILDEAGAKALASLPTGPEIYSRLAGAIASGARGMASVVAGVHRSLAYVLQAAIDGDVFEGDAPAAPSSESAPVPADAPAEDASTAAPAEEPVAAEAGAPAEDAITAPTEPPEPSSTEATATEVQEN